MRRLSDRHEGRGAQCFPRTSLGTPRCCFMGCGRSENTIIIGSKNFTEQILLGELLAQQIEGTTHYQVKRLFNLGGDVRLPSGACRRDHRRLCGIHRYGVDGHSPRAAFQQFGRSLSHGARCLWPPVRPSWLSPLGFTNTFAIMIRAEDARRFADPDPDATG